MDEGYKVVVTKSTVPIGTSRKMKEIIAGRLHERGVSARFDCRVEPGVSSGGNGWHQFRNLDLDRLLQLLKSPYFFDLRNIYNKKADAAAWV